jgi:hypothetical protein
MASPSAWGSEKRAAPRGCAPAPPGAEGLDNVVVRAQFEAQNAVDLLALGRQHNDGELGCLADRAAHIGAGHPGHHQIQDHQIGLLALREPERLVAVIGGLVRVSLRVQVYAKRFVDHRVVIADQNQRAERHEPSPHLYSVSLYPIAPARATAKRVLSQVVAFFNAFARGAQKKAPVGEMLGSQDAATTG